MWLDVVDSPTELAVALDALPGAACAVIDVVRATTSLTVMGERGARVVYAADTIPDARVLAARYPQALLVGEAGGMAPAGFDYSNAPADLNQAPLTDREVIFATSNGTRALVAAQRNGSRLIVGAALRNAQAVAELALRQGDAFLLVCAGRQQRMAIDDLYTAGKIAQLILSQAQTQQRAVELTEGAELALHLARTAGEPLDVLRHSAAGRSTIAVGREVDLVWCAEISTSSIVPRVVDVGATDVAIMFG
jgi:2-phosphosulfolactate phosphatase